MSRADLLSCGFGSGPMIRVVDGIRVVLPDNFTPAYLRMVNEECRQREAARRVALEAARGEYFRRIIRNAMGMNGVGYTLIRLRLVKEEAPDVVFELLEQLWQDMQQDVAISEQVKRLRHLIAGGVNCGGYINALEAIVKNGWNGTLIEYLISIMLDAQQCGRVVEHRREYALSALARFCKMLGTDAYFQLVRDEAEVRIRAAQDAANELRRRADEESLERDVIPF